MLRRLRSLAAPAALTLVAGAGLVSCRTDGAVAPRVTAPPPPKEVGLRVLGPSRYLEEGARWIERSTDGTDRALLNGRRVELQGAKVLRTAPSELELQGGKPVAPWIKGPARYVFWKERDVYFASSFLGEVVKIATLAADVRFAFPWLDGVGLVTDGGAVVIVPGSAADLKDARVVDLPVAGGVDGLAADERRAIVRDVFSRHRLTVDGGKTFRDLEELGEVDDYEVRGNDLVVMRAAGQDHFVGPDGKVSELAVSPGAVRGVRPPELDEGWAELSGDAARSAISRGGIPLGEGVVLVSSGDLLAKVEAATSRVIQTTSLEDLGMTDCTPLKMPDAVLLACRGEERAVVVDVTGVPRVERTFEVSGEDGGALELDGFSVADGVGLGYLGPCAGPTPVRDEVDAISGASSQNRSPQRSPVFCARASADHWVEHRLDPEDANDVIGWAPRPGGDAVALVARTDRVVPDEQRVTTRGGLRVMRFPRMEPPISLPSYSARSRASAAREMRAAADGSVEAWLTSQSYGNSTVAAVIDATGHVHTRPIPPRVDSIESDGPFALAHSDDGRLYETVDWGKRWIEVKGPPAYPPNVRPSACSAAGCSIAQYTRIGWDSVDPNLPAAVVDYETGRAGARMVREKVERRRSSTKAPIVKLDCSFASPGEGARQPDSYGFGFTPTVGYRGQGLQRLGWIGAFSLPWWQGAMPSGIDIDLAWVEPLDLDGRIRRATVPLSRSGLTIQNRPYEQRLGYVMDEDGRVELIPTGRDEACLAPVLEDAGIVAKIGGCLDEPSMGVRIKDRILALVARWGSPSLLAIELPRSDGATAVGSSRRVVRGLRDLPSPTDNAIGLGVRAGAPVAVVVDARGQAVLAPFDPSDGYLGEAERLAPLTALRVGTDARCPTGEKLGAAEARVLLPFDTAIGLVRGALPGVTPTGSAGVAVLRWSKDAACLEAVEMNVRDERYDPDGTTYEPPGQVRKVIARFGKAPPRRGTADKTPAAAKKKAAAAAASASASASAAASAAASALPGWAAPYGVPMPPPTSSSAGAVVTAAPIPTAPPLPKGAGDGTLLLIQNGFEIRQKLFCTGATP